MSRGRNGIKGYLNMGRNLNFPNKPKKQGTNITAVFPCLGLKVIYLTANYCTLKNGQRNYQEI